MTKISRTVEEAIANYNVVDGCWTYQGYKSSGGYGMWKKNGKAHTVHRLSYEAHKGKIPEGLSLDHLCRNRACINPDHLEPVTHRENCLRGVGVTAINAKKTHCKRGHEFTKENTYVHTSGRYCRECLRTAALATYHRNKVLVGNACLQEIKEKLK